jgi:hypothetical protein
MFVATLSALSFAPTVPLSQPTQGRSSVVMETLDDLKTLASKSNPVLGFWDPLGLTEYDQFEQGQEAAIGFLRHAELKHGRIAMAGFVGFIVQTNGIHFPWKLTGDVSFADISAAGGPGDQWDALPTASKLQIFGFIALMELWSENSYVLEQDGQKHYMRGGKPGYFPSLKEMPHPVPLDLWDPFGFTKKLTEEQKANKLVIELNNGRLAMLGIISFCAASKGLIVPGLSTVGIKPYAGEFMAPFAASDVSLPFVSDMLQYSIKFPGA